MAAEFQIVNWNFIGFLGFALAFASFGTMLMIFGKQNKQADDLADVTGEIEEMVTDQENRIKDVQDVYASSIVGYVQVISRSYYHPLDLYTNKWKDGELSLKKNQIRNILTNYYDNHLFHLPPIEAMEIVKSFGKKMFDKHWRLTPHMKSDMWTPDTDYGMALMIDSYKEQMYKLVELKDAFLEYCDQDMKSRDEKCQEYYDLIKKEFEEKVIPQNDDFNDVVTAQSLHDAD